MESGQVVINKVAPVMYELIYETPDYLQGCVKVAIAGGGGQAEPVIQAAPIHRCMCHMSCCSTLQ